MNKLIFVMIVMFFLSNISQAQRNVKRKSKCTCAYYENPKITESDFWMLKFQNTIKAHTVKDAESAAMVAFIYATNIYGKAIAKMEQPYSVSNVNDSLWAVSGTNGKRNKKKPWRGTFSFLIDSSGRLLFYMHEK